jgi:hypothetical protein
MIKNGYDGFISPGGDIISIGSKTHIATIIENAEMFGFTDELINSVFNKYGEKLWTECKAREEILITTFKLGWIRVNYDIRCDKFVMNTWALDSGTLDRLKQFACKVKNGVLGRKKEFSDVLLQLIMDNSLKQSTISDLALGNGEFKDIRFKMDSMQGNGLI